MRSDSLIRLTWHLTSIYNINRPSVQTLSILLIQSRISSFIMHDPGPLENSQYAQHLHVLSIINPQKPTHTHKIWAFQRKCFLYSYNVNFTTKIPRYSSCDEHLIARPRPAAILTPETTPPSEPTPVENRPIYDTLVIEPPPPL